MRTLVTIVLNNGKQYVDAGLRVKRLKEPSSSAELVLVYDVFDSRNVLPNLSHEEVYPVLPFHLLQCSSKT